MTPEKLWARRERLVAKALGGKRTGYQYQKAPDIEGSFFVGEVKTRKRLPFWLLNALSQAKGYARGNKLPLVILHQEGSHEDLVVMSSNDFKDWFGNSHPRGYPRQGETEE